MMLELVAAHRMEMSFALEKRHNAAQSNGNSDVSRENIVSRGRMLFAPLFLICVVRQNTAVNNSQ